MANSAYLVNTNLFVEVVTTDTQMVNNAGYICNGSGSLNMTLPLTSSVGNVIQVSNMQNGFTIVQNAGQSIQFTTGTTTVGAGGSISSNNNGDSITMECSVADTQWLAYASVGNGLTIV